MEIKDVENLAELARIELSDEEKQSLLGDFGSILAYIQAIEKIELNDITPVYDIKNVWREDTIELREFSHEFIVEQFPDAQPARPDGRSGGDGVFLKVKKIL